MKLIDKAVETKYRLFIGSYTRADIIKNMCPYELGLDKTACENENCTNGYEGCKLCWNRECADENEAGRDN